MVELQSVFGFKSFTKDHYSSAVHDLEELVWQTDKGIVLATALIQTLRAKFILLPSINVIERICAEAITRAARRIYTVLTETLPDTHLRRLDVLSKIKPNFKVSTLAWLRQPPGPAKARYLLEHIERLQATIPIQQGLPITYLP